ncbi:oxidoreductase [Rhizobium leguminosarum]|uniref:Probable oxidoreductase n=1 Tax=Rhizobium leguminosarum TaxID=384 RepID=A0A7W9ZSJ1_RHILE|nr:oxidoreductase [Rhizobium leguminosarum]MBB6220927.1 NAD(P)-dependent dehydrogenase (short-subunit alcohol dehydrogenase family) [Rhizobium leguminosarum]
MSTPQAPIASGFGATSTAEEVIAGHDLSGKVAVVTGGYSGLGFETARVLAEAGARVIVPARNLGKAKAAVENIPGLALEMLDLMDPGSIDDFADRFLESGAPLHLLINNAAVMANPLTRDARGYESQFSTNHLGHFQLTARLWPALVKAQGARVVAVSSRGHVFSGVDFDDPNFENREYAPYLAYGQSKTANALFAVSLDAVGAKYGIRAFSLHPGGIVTTNLVRHQSGDFLKASGYVDEHGQPVIDPENNKKTVEQGASTTVWCAVSEKLDGLGGVYCENCNIATAVPGDSTEMLGVRPWATDPELAERLWQLSERLTGFIAS